MILALFLIFFAAFALRIAPLLDSQPVVRAFDPWFQLKVTEYIADNGFGAFFTWYDDSTWVPFGRDMSTAAYMGVPFTTATVYSIVNALGIQVDVLTVALVMPAFMGALTTIVVFFIGRELHNNTVGLFSAFFMAFMPAFLQRTIAGFYDNEMIGVFAICLTLFFFTRSIKRDSLFSAIGAGLSLAYLKGSWGAADFMLDLLAMYGFFMLLFGRYDRRLLTSYLVTITLGLFVGGLVPRNGFGNLTSFQTLVPIGVGVLLVMYEVWLRVGSYREATASFLSPYMKPILLGLGTAVVGSGAYFVYASNIDLSIRPYVSNPILTIGGKFLTVINPFFRLDQRIFASVAEHLPSPWSSFYNTLLILIFFFPLGMYYLFRRGRDEDWLILLYGLTAVYFTGSMIRLGLILAPGVALLAAIAVNNTLVPFAKVVTQRRVFERRRFRMSSSLTTEHAIGAYLFIAALLSMNVFLGVQYATEGVGSPEFAFGSISEGNTLTDWQTTMNYVSNVLPPTAIVASWWDYGYWINNAGDGTTIVDNATWNSTQIALMGYAMMARNLTESLKTFHLWNATHVLVYFGHNLQAFGGDEGKWPWMVRIAEDHLGSGTIDDADFLGDDPLTPTEEQEATLERFYETTIFKLMAGFESYDEASAEALGITGDARSVDNQGIWNNQAWVTHMPVDLRGAFNEAFFSADLKIVKLYEIDYTMYYQYLNRTAADWAPEKRTLNFAIADGTLSEAEEDYTQFEVVFGGGYEATVYSRANDTHVYYGIDMANYTASEDAFGIQIAPLDSTDDPDIRVVNYDGNEYFDGYINYQGDWVADSAGFNETEFGYGDIIEFILPLENGDPQDVFMSSGMNYQIRFIWWDNINTGEPTLTTEWVEFWVPVDLY
jgi:dolichyl-diphosphooligosaccharide--protein glycosyltransferase